LNYEDLVCFIISRCL